MEREIYITSNEYTLNITKLNKLQQNSLSTEQNSVSEGKKYQKFAPWKCINSLNQNEFPGPRAAHSCELIGNQLYLFGGWNGKKALNDLVILDLETLKWSEPETIGTKPGLRNNHATTIMSRYMYLHGGHNGDIWLDDLYILDINSFVWNKITTNNEGVPSARACHSLSRVDRKLYMFGGYDGTKCYNEVEIFDTDSKTWSTPKVNGKSPLARNAHTITIVNKDLFLFGGHSGNKHLKDLHIFHTDTLTWQEPLFSGESPEGLRGHTATHIGNKIIIFGGYDGKGRSNELFILELENMHWSHVHDNEKFPGSRQRHSAVAIDHKRLIIFGGFDGTKWLNDLHLLDASLLMEGIINKHSGEEFQNNIKTLVNNKEFSDVIFKINSNNEKSYVYGHKCIIAARSKYFAEKFSQDKTLNTIEIENVRQEIFLKLMEFIYTGRIENLDNDFYENKIQSCIELLNWSNEFQLKELKSLCENKLIYGLDSSNVVSILIAAFQNSYNDLKSFAMNYILSNFQEVSKTKSFMNLELHPQLLMEVMMLSLNKNEVD
jgi:N-acetylneuraminic acid mutarotase